MQNDNQEKEEIASRRKRVNRLKKLIIFAIVILLLVPTILCMILGMRVSKLQKQVNELSIQYGNSESAVNTNSEIAFAAVKSKDDENIEPTITPTVPKNPVPVTEPAKVTESASKQETARVTQEPVTITGMPSDLATDSKETDDSNVNSKDSEAKEKSSEINDNHNGIYAGKKVYLTFDDGPSIYTGKILDILSEYKIKATFFVIGKTDEKSKELYKRIVKEGHTLGMHSFSHRYEKIYNSIEDFDKDFTKLWELLYDTTGYKPSIYRFPGGSDNLVNDNGMDMFIKYLNDKSFVYFDWNVVNGDATGIDYSEQELVQNVLDGVANKKRSIVLMHDSQTKKATADSLGELIDDLIKGGAEILPLDKDVMPIQMIRSDSVK